MKRLILYILLILLSLVMQAQEHTVHDADIRSLQVVVNGEDGALPIIRLGTGDRIRVDFDDMTHEYRRYTYRIVHCNFEWQPTEGLFESEYIDMTADEHVLENYEPSLNTTVLYNHYSLEMSPRNTRLLLSGNYQLQIYRDSETGDEPTKVVTVCFGVKEQKASVQATASGDTDIDYHQSHQQLQVAVSLQADIDNSRQDAVRICVVKNQDYNTAVINPKPTAVWGNTLQWTHTQELIFPAGNEYRRFEMLSTHVAGMHIDHLNWDDPYYYAGIMQDEVSENYLYDEDHNGLSVFRSEDAQNDNTESDYVYVTFNLNAPHPLPYRLYLSGKWTHHKLDDRYLMTYDEETGLYHCTLLLKTGYYDYTYVPRYPKGTPLSQRLNPIEGDYWPTENEYDILVYYMPPGSRYDRLIGHQTVRFRK